MNVEDKVSSVADKTELGNVKEESSKNGDETVRGQKACPATCTKLLLHIEQHHPDPTI
jgi:hypothetical protein